MEKRITMKQIADELGISINAVSLALNNKQGVSESTRRYKTAIFSCSSK